VVTARGMRGWVGRHCSPERIHERMKHHIGEIWFSPFILNLIPSLHLYY
jgi:hypothetical protein